VKKLWFKVWKKAETKKMEAVLRLVDQYSVKPVLSK